MNIEYSAKHALPSTFPVPLRGFGTYLRARPRGMRVICNSVPSFLAVLNADSYVQYGEDLSVQGSVGTFKGTDAHWERFSNIPELYAKTILVPWCLHLGLQCGMYGKLL